jgi:hypothetical protein
LGKRQILGKIKIKCHPKELTGIRPDDGKIPLG